MSAWVAAAVLVGIGLVAVSFCVWQLVGCVRAGSPVRAARRAEVEALAVVAQMNADWAASGRTPTL